MMATPEPSPARTLEQCLAPLGTRLALAGNRPLRFDDPGRAALVLAGSVDLFLVALAAGEPSGSRQHFTTVPAGGLVLGIATDDALLDLGLLLVAPIGTEILEVTPASIAQLARDPEGAALLAPALERWIQALTHGLAQWVTPRPEIHGTLARDDTLIVPAGQRCTVRGALGWVRVAPAACLFLDMEELPEDGPELLFPLAAEGWLVMLQGQELRTVTTREALDSQQAWKGLAALHRLVPGLGAMNLRLANVDEHHRLQARVDATAAKRLLGFRQLMAAVDTRSADVLEVLDTQPLAAAARLIGLSQGFEVRLPPVTGHDDPAARVTLAELAQSSGFRVRAVSLRTDWWKADFGTLLGFERATGRPLVLRADPRGRPEIVDPMGPRTLPFESLREQLAEQAFQLTGSLPTRPIGYRELLGFGFAGRGKDVAATLATGALLGLLSMALPVAAAALIDQVIPDHETGRLIEMGILLAVLGMTGFILTYISLLAYARIEAHVGWSLQSSLMDRLLRLPMAFFQQYSSGDLATRVGAIATIQSLVSMASANAILSGIFSVFSFALMFAYDAALALWASLAVLFYVLCSALLLRLRLRHERPLAAINGTINSTLLQLILGVSKIRLCAAEDRAFARWAAPFARGRRERMSAEILGAFQSTLNEAFALSGLLLFVLVIGKPSANASLVALGAFAALLVAFQRFAAGITQMTEVLTQLLAIQPQIERARPLLDACPEGVESREPPGAISGALDIAQIRFRYASDGPLILDDVSLKAAPGEMIAIVGPSGSGKSTLMRLLLGFEDAETGSILIDGKELSRLDAVAVRRQMGVVLQGSQPLPGSLYENIVGTAGGTLEDAWEAAERVGLAEDIRAMPMGMHSVILEGGNSLSGGQIQRLMIARAIVGRPRILLLDEATSALDNRVQAVVTSSLERLSVTRVVVAHRLSTVIHADRIYVLVDGRLVETGRYSELMAANGVFARLAERQMV